jgi:Zn-dependent protease with chaperone function
MNFFEHQANARRQTGRLLVYFMAAVLATVLALNAGMFLLAGFAFGGLAGTWLWHDWSLQVSIGTLLVILGGSLIEYLRLRGGGEALAKILGARRIDFSTGDSRERQFINVVAEMAIASGVPAPLLYVMDREPGINAFVAGMDIDSTVMVVTAGALEAFDRDELQAVIGHEFSHIFHGDMRLNVRLMALLAGILALGQMGSFLMRISSNGNSSSRRRGGIVHLFFVGLLLWLVGSIGLFFSRLIKAAISRQREFLADASSVQFTRNPDGLAEALLKIRNHTGLSWLDNLRAESMSHMCFAETLTFSSWFATHPPLEERIALLGKHYLVRDRVRQREQQRQVQTAGEVAAVQGLAATGEAAELPPIAYLPGASTGLAGEAIAAMVAPATMGAAAFVARTGTVNPADLASAQALHRRLPPGIKQALESSEGAQALLFALVARYSTAPSAVISGFLQEHEPALAERVKTLYKVMEGLDLAFALPLTELALPRLHLMAHDSRHTLLQRLQKLAQLDRRLTTFEFALLMLLRKHLHAAPRARSVRLSQCQSAAAVLVATLLRAGGTQADALERTFQRMMRTVFNPAPMLPPPDLTRLPMLAKSLQVLSGLGLNDKRLLLELAGTAVLADAEVRLEEYELLRVVAALLDCPMPMLHD